jgi:hypothetical protein
MMSDSDFQIVDRDDSDDSVFNDGEEYDMDDASPVSLSSSRNGSPLQCSPSMRSRSTDNSTTGGQVPVRWTMPLIPVSVQTISCICKPRAALTVLPVA